MKKLFVMAGVVVLVAIGCSSENVPKNPETATSPPALTELPPTPTVQPTARPTATIQPTATPTPQPETGAWEYWEDVDLLTDEIRAGIFVLSVSGESRFGEPFSLGVSCDQSGFFQTGIIWEDFIELDSTNVTYRIDSQDAQTSKWTLGSDGDYSYLWGPLGKQFVNSLLDGEQLVARVSPYSGTSLTATFDIIGLDEALVPIFEICP